MLLNHTDIATSQTVSSCGLSSPIEITTDRIIKIYSDFLFPPSLISRLNSYHPFRTNP